MGDYYTSVKNERSKVIKNLSNSFEAGQEKSLIKGARSFLRPDYTSTEIHF